MNLFLCGDVMTGRGIDQILPRPSDPAIHEGYLRDARDYVGLAERSGGPIPRRAATEYVWGDALSELASQRPDARIVNLETSVTVSEDWERKGINYRMHPANIGVLRAAGIDACALANNHVLDWGRAGLLETLETLAGAGVRFAGAGRSLREAQAPAALDVPGGARVLLFSMGTPDSGVPRHWAATPERPGVDFLPDLSPKRAREIRDRVAAARRSRDVVVISLHWGGNWGYEIPDEQRRFAHALIDEAGVDLVHGHSSHHPKGIEVHRGKLILYGCGDFVNDYEGIEGYEGYRSDLALMYLARLEPGSGSLVSLRMVPFRTTRFRLERASHDDALWLRSVLAREGRALGTEARIQDDGSIALGTGLARRRA